ncbi:hypothetical protein SLS63_006167 [Diaporthe eres]|uniref:DNA2/NAM7 helicase-like C-terminal domain-containing protein n=1 Tax=Diaporthe eres TaxID=83184 RepID=A0ABR1P8M2_DIAER
MNNSAMLLFFLEPSRHDAMLPREGEACDIVVPKFGKCPATRVDNPCSLWRIRDDALEKCLAFEIYLVNKQKIIAAFPKLGLPQKKMSIPPLSDQRCLRVTIELRVSTSTRDAEVDALSTLEEARKYQRTGTSQWQIDAYKYFLNLGSPTGLMRLFWRFPHMLDPILKPERASPRLVRLFQALNDQQKFAFMNLLNEIPNGICIVHGCPGAGKTHWNLVVAAALQSRDEIMLSGAQSPTPWNNKVLYLIDINRPLNDTANKMTRLYGELGLTKKCRIDGSTTPRVAIRMHCWSYEKTTASRNRLQAEWEELNHRMDQRGKAEEQRQSNSAQQTGNSGAESTGESKEGPLQQFMSKTDESQRLDVYRFSTAFRKAEQSFMRRADQAEECIAPSLDEAAWAMYQRFRDTKYARLSTIRRRINLVRSTNLDYLENAELETVYRDTLLDADIVFTTPVSASKFSSSMFSPTLVIFDEAPHARELSTLVPLAHFNPAVWVFSGDVRQTKPFVKSSGNDTCQNEYIEQLRVSMMERAFRKNPDGPSLNINHRARGNLQRLASTLFYRSKMIPAIDPQQTDAIPPSTIHLRSKYIMPMKRNEGPQVSRLLVKLKDPGPAAQVDERSWWHPGHQRWVMDLVLKLLKDEEFRQTSGDGEGTILIMAFYKQAFIQYRKAIRELKTRHPAFKDRVIEARTVDSAQGHEADIVILDFVRQRPTSHLNNPNRLCVALTRARQAEFILMHDHLISWLYNSTGCLGEMVSVCKRAGEYISDPAQLTDASAA